MALGDLVREMPDAILVDERARSVEIHGVHHDSREVEPGDLFVARRGKVADGNRFVDQAVARGAAAIVVAEDAPRPAVTVPVVVAKEPQRALAFAASAVYGHPTFGLDVIGITGTNGKTTTSTLVEAMLEDAGFVPGVVGTLGNRLRAVTEPSRFTSPEADEFMRVAARMKALGATHLITEVSSIALSAFRLDAVRYRVAAFTNLTQDHLDVHGTMQAYGEAKARLFLELAPAGSAINVDDPFGRALAARLMAGAEQASYGRTSADASIRPRLVRFGERGIDLTVTTPAGEVVISSPLVGEHNVENLLCAVAIGTLLGLSTGAISRGLSRDVAVPGRLERCDDPAVDDVIVLVDYAHTPDALARVLGSVRASVTGRILCVFGCGGDRDPKKRPLMGEAAGKGADQVFVTNDNPRSEEPRAIADAILPGLVPTGTPFEVELDRRAAIGRAVATANPRDVVVIAGKGHETYQIVGDVVSDFDDRAVAREALAARRAR